MTDFRLILQHEDIQYGISETTIGEKSDMMEPGETAQDYSHA